MKKHAQLIIKLEQMVLDGLESHVIDKEIENQKLPDDERRFVFQYIQDFQIKNIVKKQAKAEQTNIKFIGWIFFIFGLFVTIGSYLYLSKGFILAYGMILFGIYIIVKRRLSDEEIDDSLGKRSMFDKHLFNKFK